MSKKFNIGLLQLSFSKDTSENLKKAISWIEKAAKDGAQVICLPELFRSQYFCQTEDINNFHLAETIPGPSTKVISEAAKKNKVSVVVTLFEKRSSKFFHHYQLQQDYCGKLLKIFFQITEQQHLLYFFLQLQKLH